MYGGTQLYVHRFQTVTHLPHYFTSECWTVSKQFSCVSYHIHVWCEQFVMCVCVRERERGRERGEREREREREGEREREI